VETNYDTFEVLRIDGMPKVEVHIVPSRERPTGVGEPGVPPIGPALGNAYLAATGELVATLRFTPELSI
jgi:isoquinoline 1-oxidoreductase beta subunit